MDKELIQIEKTELIETLGKLLNDFQVDDYRNHEGTVQNVIHTMIDDTVQRSINSIGDELLFKYNLGHYKDIT